MMPEVLNVAASDDMELAQAADIVGGSLRGFNLDAKEAQRISDTLAYTSSHSATNVTMAGAALHGISGTAVLQGISPEIAASYIGVLANRANLQGSEAATTLERSISAIAMRKGDTAKFLDQYKIATVMKSGDMVRLEEIVTQLYDKTISGGKSAGLLHMSLGNVLGVIGLIAMASYEFVTHWKEITQWADNTGRAISSVDTGKISSAKTGTLSRSDDDYGIAVNNYLVYCCKIRP